MILDMTLKKEYKSGFQIKGSVQTASEKFGIFGSSGSGKTTVMKILAGWEAPDEGSIRIGRKTLLDVENRISKKPEERRLAMVFQDAALFPHLTVKQNIVYGYKRQRAVSDKRLFENCVETLRLNNLLERKTNNLSGGEKQRVAIGRAILAIPRLLLLDECLTGLDEKIKLTIAGYIKTLCHELALPYIFVSHSILEMQLMTDEIMVIKNGQFGQVAKTENWMRKQMFGSGQGYNNLLTLINNGKKEGLYNYAWGKIKIAALTNGSSFMVTARLSSRDIMLFKRHPQAISARNLFKCKVGSTWQENERVGVELKLDDRILVAEIVQAAADELKLKTGATVFAAVKASAFQIK